MDDAHGFVTLPLFIQNIDFEVNLAVNDSVSFDHHLVEDLLDSRVARRCFHGGLRTAPIKNLKNTISK